MVQPFGPYVEERVGGGQGHVGLLLVTESIASGVLDQRVDADGVRGAVDEAEAVQHAESLYDLPFLHPLPVLCSLRSRVCVCGISAEVGTGGFGGSQCGGDAIGRQDRQQSQQGVGQAGRWEGVGILDAEVPDSRDREFLVVGQCVGGEFGQACGVLGQHPVVGGRGMAGVGEVGGSLGESERQIPQGMSQDAQVVLGFAVSVVAEASGEEGQGFGRGEDVDVDTCAAVAQGGVAAPGGGQGLAEG
ncbi:hypothetical protein AWI43_30960 [Streptomyces sp. WAC04657]|nr:hypothetical protein AWI43_30960 [Streptomyces sp. WAC04657]